MARTTIRTEDITASEVTTAKMATDPTNASNLASGTVGSARMGSGSASSSTVLYGDGTWKTEPVTDTGGLEDDIALLGFKVASNGSLAKYNLVDQTVDDFQDTSGVDASASTDEIRNAAGKYYSGDLTVLAAPTGGAETTHGIYSVHTFTSNDDFVTPSTGTISYMIVGGGGGGGQHYGAGGGGGGGVQVTASASIAAGTFPVVIGATSSPGSSGNSSSFNSVTANGGAGGGGYAGTGGTSGAPGSNAGGTGDIQSYGETGGGGGGAGGTGNNSSPGSSGGSGGDGTANDYRRGSSINYGTGGSGGGARDTSGGSATDGGGSGGNNSSTGTSPPTNRGGGGGGNNTGAQQSGASGAAVIRYVTGAFNVITHDNMTLISTTTAAQAAPTKGDIVLTYTNGAGTTTLDTDLTAEISADGGSNWTTLPLASEGSTGSHNIATSHNVTIGTVPGSGWTMAYRIKTLNQAVGKTTRIQAVSLGWS